MTYLKETFLQTSVFLVGSLNPLLFQKHPNLKCFAEDSQTSRAGSVNIQNLIVL